MFKPLLILMLATTQLLAGSVGTLYLCIKGDGSFCTLHTSFEPCHRCEKNEPVCQQLPEQSAACTCCHSGEPEEFREVAESLLLSDTALTVQDPCGCTRILLKQDEANANQNRLTADVGLRQFVAMAANLPGLVLVDDADANASGEHGQYRQPTLQSHALTVLSTTQIRC